MNFSVTKLPRCRWCGKEPEFAPPINTGLSVCEHCDAMQSALVHLSSASLKLKSMEVNIFLNPDGSVFIEQTRHDGFTRRYTLDLAFFKEQKAYHESATPLEGRFLDKGIR